MVFVTALLGAILGLSLPVASGIIVDQILPAADLPAARHRLSVPRGHHRRDRDLPGDSGAAGHAHRRPRLGDLDTRILGSLASASEPVLRAGFPRAISRRGRWNSPKSSKRSPGAVVATVVTGFFSFFNLGLLYYYSWKLALGTTVLLAVLVLRDCFCFWEACCATRRSIRAIDGAISGLLARALGRNQHASNGGG